jgi:hypothetical protein
MFWNRLTAKMTGTGFSLPISACGGEGGDHYEDINACKILKM